MNHSAQSVKAEEVDTSTVNHDSSIKLIMNKMRLKSCSKNHALITNHESVNGPNLHDLTQFTRNALLSSERP